MNIIKKIKLKYFTRENIRWATFLDEIFSSFTQSIDILNDKDWQSLIDFNVEKHSKLLHMSLAKNNHALSIYLLNNKQLTIPSQEFNKKEKLFAKTHLLDNLYHVLEKDHIAHLGLMACHHPFHLLELEKIYNPDNYKEVCEIFFNHPRFKPLYQIKQRQKAMLSVCHPKAREMLSHIFLDMALDRKPMTNIKIQKI